FLSAIPSCHHYILLLYFFFQAEDGIRDFHVTGVQTCALPISVLQLHNQVLVLLARFDAVVGDVALALEDLGDVRLDLRVRQYNGVVVRRVRITQTCQEVCDRVGHRHGDLSTFLALVPLTRGLWRSGMGPCMKQGTSKTFTSSLCSRQGAVPRAPSPGRRFGTARTCGTPNAGDRNADSGCRRAPCTWACGQ